MTVTYKLSPGNASTFGLIELTSATSFSIDTASSEVLLGTDGSEWLGYVGVDDKHYRISVAVTDNSILANAVGDCGALVLRGAERSCGDGSGSALTHTISNATLVSRTSRIGHGGTSELSLNFVAAGEASGDLYVDPMVIS